MTQACAIASGNPSCATFSATRAVHDARVASPIASCLTPGDHLPARPDVATCAPPSGHRCQSQARVDPAPLKRQPSKDLLDLSVPIAPLVPSWDESGRERNTGDLRGFDESTVLRHELVLQPACIVERWKIRRGRDGLERPHEIVGGSDHWAITEHALVELGSAGFELRGRDVERPREALRPLRSGVALSAPT